MGNWPGQRIAEAIIIGTIAALGSSYVTVKVLDERVANIGQRVTALDERLNRAALDQAAKNAPAGSDVAVAAVKAVLIK